MEQVPPGHEYDPPPCKGQVIGPVGVVLERLPGPVPFQASGLKAQQEQHPGEVEKVSGLLEEIERRRNETNPDASGEGQG